MPPSRGARSPVLLSLSLSLSLSLTLFSISVLPSKHSPNSRRESREHYESVTVLAVLISRPSSKRSAFSVRGKCGGDARNAGGKETMRETICSFHGRLSPQSVDAARDGERERERERERETEGGARVVGRR